ARGVERRRTSSRRRHRGSNAAERRTGTEYEIRIRQCAHLGDIETFELNRCRHSIPDNRIDHLEEDVEADEHEDGTGERTYALRGELACVSVEKALHRATHPIPAAAAGTR